MPQTLFDTLNCGECATHRTLDTAGKMKVYVYLDRIEFYCTAHGTIWTYVYPK